MYDFAYDPRAANNTLIYSWCYYEPVCLPIFGEYFDYGHIDEIEKNSSTKAIEKHFGCPIEVVVGAQGELPCAGMFVHRDIYQTMIDTRVNEWGNTGLDSFGVIDREKLNEEYDTLRKAMIDLANIPKQKKEEKWDYRKFDTTMAQHHVDDLERKYHFREFETFMKIYKPLIKRGWLKKELTDFILFVCSMGSANVHFFPAANGCQFGNHYANRAIHQKTLEILNNKIIEDEKERAE